MMRVKAAQEAAAAADSQVRPDASQYELMLAKLYEDKRRLKGIESMKARAELKRELLPEYEPYITGVLMSDAGVTDDVLMTLMLWNIDAGEYADALDIARYAMKHRLPMPDKFQRSTATLIAEEFAEAVIKGGADLSTYILEQVLRLTADQDMPDEVRAKLHKAVGLSFIEEGNLASAQEHLKEALALHDGCGVKTQIKQLEKQLQQNKPGSDSEQA
jgi:hypothetical protein